MTTNFRLSEDLLAAFNADMDDIIDLIADAIECLRVAPKDDVLHVTAIRNITTARSQMKQAQRSILVAYGIESRTPKKKKTDVAQTVVRRKRWRDVWWQNGWFCFYCGAALAGAVQGRSDGESSKTVGLPASYDHVVPRSRGGTNELWNVVPACEQCNTEKGILSLEDFKLTDYFREKCASGRAASMTVDDLRRIDFGPSPFESLLATFPPDEQMPFKRMFHEQGPPYAMAALLEERERRGFNVGKGWREKIAASIAKYEEKKHATKETPE